MPKGKITQVGSNNKVELDGVWRTLDTQPAKYIKYLKKGDATYSEDPYKPDQDGNPVITYIKMVPSAAQTTTGSFAGQPGKSDENLGLILQAIEGISEQNEIVKTILAKIDYKLELLLKNKGIQEGGSSDKN